jgi:hypothetical protein
MMPERLHRTSEHRRNRQQNQIDDGVGTRSKPYGRNDDDGGPEGQPCRCSGSGVRPGKSKAELSHDIYDEFLFVDNNYAKANMQRSEDQLTRPGSGYSLLETNVLTTDRALSSNAWLDDGAFVI